MRYDSNKLCTLIFGTALVFSCALPRWAVAQGVNSLPDGPVACDAFERSSHGSWTVLRQATLYPNGVPLGLVPGRPSPRTRSSKASRSPQFSTAIAETNEIGLE